MFDIRSNVSFDTKGRAICPSCAIQGKDQKKNLSLIPNSTGSFSGAYKCHRGCSSADIRSSLGQTKRQQIPASTQKATSKPTTVPPSEVSDQCRKLIDSNGPAKQWLQARGITDEMSLYYRLGVSRCRVGNKQKWAISIPLPATKDATAYYIKKRVCPWDDSAAKSPEYMPWKQYGIPQMVWFTHEPENATETWLCEGEWDAIALGWMMKDQADIAVACFTCGCGNVPPDDQLDRLPGQVTLFYDRNDKPLKNGDIPGDKGAIKAAERIGDRARLALVPMQDDCTIHGWDVSDAINQGFDQAAFMDAASRAQKPLSNNPLRRRLLTNDELIEQAPDYVDWLVPDLLTHNELFAVAAPPRGGKSLLAMTLTKCVATGEKFLDRPVTQGPCIYVNLEDSDAKIKEREEAQGWGKDLPIYWLNKFKLAELPHLVELISEIQPRLVVLDTLSRIRNDGVAEASAEMSMVLEPLQETAKEFNCCILLIHHTKKIDTNTDNSVDVFDSIRGSGAIRATCRGCIIIAPAENSYRLLSENGHGKHDLRVRLDANTLEWKLLGRWAPTINLDQRQIALDYLNKVGSATMNQIAEETQLPRRSLYTVLARLVSDDVLTKTGTQKSAIYTRPVQQVQLLNCLLNSSNEEPANDRASVQQKNNLFILNSVCSEDVPILDHPPKTPKNQEELNQGKALSDVAHGSPPPCTVNAVELTTTEGSNVDAEGDSSLQQQFNSSSTVELVELDPPQTTLDVGSPPPPVGVQNVPVEIGTVRDADKREILIGDVVEILVGRFCGSICDVVAVLDDGQIEVKRSSWAITRDYAPGELRLWSDDINA